MNGAPEQGPETCTITPEDNSDVVIVGAGLAGAAVALSLPETLRVTLLVKDTLPVCASQHAQGGIAAVLSADDSLEQHMEDTLDAGAGLCRPEAVRHIVGLGPESLAWLCNLGVEFSCDEDGHLHLTREGGHSKRRIAHAGDASGRAIMAALNQRLRMRGNIQVREHMLALDVCIARTGAACPAWWRMTSRLAATYCCGRRMSCWRLAGLGACTRAPVIHPARPAMASPWPGARARLYAALSSYNSILPALSRKGHRLS